MKPEGVFVLVAFSSHRNSWSLLRGELAVLLLCLSTSAAGQDSGVLLGLRSWDQGPRYTSLWIYTNGARAKNIEVPGLLVPRKSEFWVVSNYFTRLTGEEIESPTGTKITNDIFEEHIWALPVGHQPTISPRPHELVTKVFTDDACESIFREVQFVNETHLSVEKDTGYECGVHPDGETEFDVFSLDDLNGKRLSITDLLGEAGGEAFEKGLADRTKQNLCETSAQTDDKNWRLVRSQGHWIAQGWANTYRLCGYGFNFGIPIALPESFVGYDLLPFEWATLAAQIPKLDDAFSSPARDLLVAVTDKEFLVFRPRGGQLGDPTLRLRTKGIPTHDEPSGMQVVMSQWVLGGSVSRWTEQLEAIRKMDISVQSTTSK